MEDLCLALRDAGNLDHHLPGGATVVSYIDQVKSIAAELRRRGVDSGARIALLSQQAGWQADRLLADCLSFPETLPYVYGANGVRQRFACTLCGRAEFPDGTDLFVCGDCLNKAIFTLENPAHVPGLFLYRTLTPGRRCVHAGDDTIRFTVAGDDDDWFDNGRCLQFLQEEKLRRAS